MKKYLSYCFFIILMFQSCDDILEEDISDNNVILIAPVDKARINGNTVQFRWNALEGALDYRIRITGNEQLLVLDSLVNSVVFDYPLNPGEYKWAVRGENFAYVTPYSIDYDFMIEESTDLTRQEVVLSSPQNNAYLNNTDITCSWQPIGTSESYNFELFRKEGINQTTIFQQSNIVGTSVTTNSIMIGEDAEYIWQVQAVNSTSASEYFKRTFFVDKVDPPVPSLLKPTINQEFNVNDEVTFEWSFADTGEILSIINATIEISINQNFSSIFLTDTNTTNTFSNVFTTAGTYYWRIKGEDAAGNSGAYNLTGVFKVN